MDFPPEIRQASEHWLAAPRKLREIREARAAKSGSADHGSTAAGMFAELKELASMLEAGLITREEFDRLKSKLLEG
jgi:hypothetical protein